MKVPRIICVLVGLWIMTTPVVAESPDPNYTAFMGVLPDWRHLPELLSRHLNLPSGKGLRIENVFRDSPAEKAGLERDDILVTFQGQDVNDARDFRDAVVKAGIGRLVFLDVIHAGQRKTVRLTLSARPKSPEFKYPPSPDGMFGFRMGDIWRQDPNGMWIRMDRASDVNGISHPMFPKEVYTFTYDQTTVIVEGNPHSDDSTVIVKSGQSEYKGTVGHLGKLPSAYLDQVKQALKQARQDSERANRMWTGRRGGGGREGRGGTPWGDRTPPSEGRSGSSRDYTQRILDSLTRYLEGLDRSPDKPDMDRLRLLEDKLRQLQAKIDELQSQANKGKDSNPSAEHQGVK